jgi:hypothetical protein
MNTIQNIKTDNKLYTWIKVNTSKGMFSSELAVIINLFDGNKVSLFADRCLLKEDQGNWFLRVGKIKTNHKSQVVLLPIEPFENSSRAIEVPL